MGGKRIFYNLSRKTITVLYNCESNFPKSNTDGLKNQKHDYYSSGVSALRNN